MRVVATLTTLPGRYDILIKTLVSLNSQIEPFDEIYLGISDRADRLDLTYADLPDDVKELCTVVYLDRDYGPVTKICGGLVSEKDPNTVIMSFDDDVEYPPDFSTVMLNHHKNHPNVAICGTGSLVKYGMLGISIRSNLKEFRSLAAMWGFHIPRKGRKCTIVYGVGGVLYKRGFFPPTKHLEKELFHYALEDRDIFLNDDILISGYLSKVGVDRMIFNDIPSVLCLENEAGNALSKDFFKAIKSYKAALKKCKYHDMFENMEYLPYDDITIIKISLVFLLVIGIVWSFCSRTVF
jgi:hypothetical protein